MSTWHCFDLSSKAKSAFWIITGTARVPSVSSKSRPLLWWHNNLSFCSLSLSLSLSVYTIYRWNYLSLYFEFSFPVISLTPTTSASVLPHPLSLSLSLSCWTQQYSHLHVWWVTATRHPTLVWSLTIVRIIYHCTCKFSFPDHTELLCYHHSIWILCKPSIALSLSLSRVV